MALDEAEMSKKVTQQPKHTLKRDEEARSVGQTIEKKDDNRRNEQMLIDIVDTEGEALFRK